MNLTELVQEVLDWTARPDLEAQARSAIRRTVLSLHRTHVFWRDLQSFQIVPGLVSEGTILLSGPTAPRFRGFHSVKDNALRLVDPDDLFDLDGYPRTDCIWAAGSAINWRASTGSSTITVYYLQDPDIATATFSSWIADLHPDAIITSAVAALMSLKGEDSIRQRAAQMAQEEVAALITAHSTAILR
jgi:hypothetical protein